MVAALAGAAAVSAAAMPIPMIQMRVPSKEPMTAQWCEGTRRYTTRARKYGAGQRLTIRKRSRLTLATLPAASFEVADIT